MLKFVQIFHTEIGCVDGVTSGESELLRRDAARSLKAVAVQAAGGGEHIAQARVDVYTSAVGSDGVTESVIESVIE